MNDIFSVVNFQDLNFPIVQIELLTMLKHYEILSNFEKIANLLHKFDDNFIIWFQCQFRILKGLVILTLKIQFAALFNYFILIQKCSIDIEVWVGQSGSVTHQMAVVVPSISCCLFKTTIISLINSRMH